MGFLNFEGLQHFFSKLPEKFAELRHAHTKEDIVGLEEAVVTDDNNGNVSIDFLTGEGSVISSSDSGVVLYQVSNPGNGITATGHIEPNELNSVILSDATFKYKRIKIYARMPNGLACADFPLDSTTQGTTEGFGDRTGGVFTPAAEHINGATKNLVYRLQWCVRPLEGIGWQFQFTQAGWLDFGFNGAFEDATHPSGVLGPDGYTIRTSITAEKYMTWNQRHNAASDVAGHEGEYNYTIYKIVGYLE